jgi:hypothetical protein
MARETNRTLFDAVHGDDQKKATGERSEVQ